MLSLRSRPSCLPVSLHLGILLLITLILNENWGVVVGRTWPRMKSYGKIYAKDALFTANVTTTSETPSLGVTASSAERNSLNEINSDPSPGDYNFLNGNVSSGCGGSSHHQPSQSHSKSGGDSGWLWTNDRNCVAGPFHLREDVNQSVYSKLCPSPTGKFPIEGTCGWYAECKDGQEFTLNKCEKSGNTFNPGAGKCVEATGPCTDDLGEVVPKLTLRELLQRIIQFLLRTGGIQRPFIISHPEDDRVAVETHKIGDGLQVLDETTPVLTSAKGRSLVEPSGIVAAPPTSSPLDQQLKDICKFSSTHGLHAHPTLCSNYLQCGPTEGTYFLKTCGPGTVFNPEMLICDWPANVPSCVASADGTYLVNSLNHENRLRRKRSSLSGVVAGDKVKFPLSRNSMTRKRREVERRFSSAGKALACNAQEEDYITPDPDYCNKYRICSNSRIVSVTCGRGTLFNPVSGVCDFADEVDCSTRKMDFATYGCDKGDFYRAPHVDFCNKFVECNDGALAIKSCPPGTLYEREESICDHAFKVTCRKRISLEHDIDVNFRTHHHKNETDAGVLVKRSVSWGRNSRSNKLNLACETNYIAPHPTICNQFVECEQRRIFIKTCGPGTAFNPEIGKCDWPRNIREPVSGDCTKFKECVRNTYKTHSCGRSQRYDLRQRKCVQATQNEIAQCSFTVVPTTEHWPIVPESR